MGVTKQKINHYIKYEQAKDDRLTWNITRVNLNHINDMLEHAYEHTESEHFHNGAD